MSEAYKINAADMIEKIKNASAQELYLGLIALERMRNIHSQEIKSKTA